MHNPTYSRRLDGRPIIGGCIIPLMNGSHVRLHMAGTYGDYAYTADKGRSWYTSKGTALEMARRSGRLDVLGSDE